MAYHIFILSDQSADLEVYMSCQSEKTIWSPVYV